MERFMTISSQQLVNINAAALQVENLLNMKVDGQGKIELCVYKLPPSRELYGVKTTTSNPEEKFIAVNPSKVVKKRSSFGQSIAEFFQEHMGLRSVTPKLVQKHLLLSETAQILQQFVGTVKNLHNKSEEQQKRRIKYLYQLAENKIQSLMTWADIPKDNDSHFHKLHAMHFLKEQLRHEFPEILEPKINRYPEKSRRANNKCGFFADKPVARSRSTSSDSISSNFTDYAATPSPTSPKK